MPRLLPFLLLACVSRPALSQQGGDEFLRWPAAVAERVGGAMRATGRVGGAFNLRIQSTNRAYNYKLRATWLTPEVVRASARLEQIREHLDDDEARRLVSAAEEAADTVVLVEIDPREGSGVIPTNWVALLQPKGQTPEGARTVKGREVSALRNLPALRGVAKRDYAYDQFWVAFPLKGRDGVPLFDDGDREAEIIVRIHEKEGRAAWTIPPSVRERMRTVVARP